MNEDIILQKHRKSALINLCKSRRNKIDQQAAELKACRAELALMKEKRDALQSEVERLKESLRHFDSIYVNFHDLRVNALQSENAKLREALEKTRGLLERYSDSFVDHRLTQMLIDIEAALSKPEIKAKYDGAKSYDVRGWKPEDDGH